jgi:hypothetical protein
MVPPDYVRYIYFHHPTGNPYWAWLDPDNHRKWERGEDGIEGMVTCLNEIDVYHVTDLAASDIHSPTVIEGDTLHGQRTHRLYTHMPAEPGLPVETRPVFSIYRILGRDPSDYAPGVARQQQCPAS